MSNKIAAFTVDDDMDYLMPGDTVENAGLQWLLDELPVEEDKELGIEEVRVSVVACSDGTLYDVLLNDVSVGYFALKAYCQCLPGLKMPTLFAIREEFDTTLGALCEETDYYIYVVPMFGDVVPC